MVYSGAWRKLIHEKNQKQKISWHCPFNILQVLSDAWDILLLEFSIVQVYDIDFQLSSLETDTVNFHRRPGYLGLNEELIYENMSMKKGLNTACF